ncbi:MAG: Periplasmic pH-dependent serine endoprotease DegQ [Phycisphaerae bacterium]|nr:Periplasmic pH-dependent serine endoprotease DegQ [Phycisphaerae bacterium]
MNECKPLRLIPMAMLIALSTALAADPAPLPRAPTPQQLHYDRRSPVVVAVEQVKDAVVNISSTRLVQVSTGIFNDEEFERFFGMPDPFSRTVKATSLGSGVVIHPDGYVLTNAHVVARASEITCTFGQQTQVKARLVSADPAHDLAILKIDSPKPLPYVRMGRSDDLMIGETVIAIGNPLGYSHTVTTGVVSAVEREVQLGQQLVLKGLIQTDASINPGNSGGPLLNVNAELIGVNTAIRGDAQNIGFAIPIQTARDDLAYLLDFARVNDLLFGATLADAKEGLTVNEVKAGTPAAEGGLAAGDRVRSVDGKECPTLMDFNVMMLGKAPGQTCRLAVVRDGKNQELKVQLLAAPKPDGNALLWEHFGLKVREVDAAAARKFNLQPGAGLMVVQMAENSQADRIGLQVGDLLVQVDRLRVNSLDDLGKALKGVPPGQTLQMTFVRGRYQLWTKLTAK